MKHLNKGDIAGRLRQHANRLNDLASLISEEGRSLTQDEVDEVRLAFMSEIKEQWVFVRLGYLDGNSEAITHAFEHIEELTLSISNLGS